MSREPPLNPPDDPFWHNFWVVNEFLLMDRGQRDKREVDRHMDRIAAGMLEEEP